MMKSIAIIATSAALAAFGTTHAQAGAAGSPPNDAQIAQIERAVEARPIRELTHRRGTRESIAIHFPVLHQGVVQLQLIIKVTFMAIVLIAPRIDALLIFVRVPRGGFFPFRLGQQAPSCPRTITHSVLP